MLDRLTTEQRNAASERVDEMSSLEIVDLMNREDQTVAAAVGKERLNIAKAVELITSALGQSGRLVYIGAGTSGRLGVLDASECPPTFNTDPSEVVGLIAGGHKALVQSIEGAEDFPEYGERDLRQIDLCQNDILVGIATSGRTPYVMGGLKHAQQTGCKTIGLACNPDSELALHADVMICPVVGPEIVSGSTRLKAGTATKMVLNILTTASMVRLGKTFGNLMVDLRASNSKLRERSKRIVCQLTTLSDDQAEAMLERCNGELKTAIIAARLGVDAATARQLLVAAKGHLRAVMDAEKNE